MPPHAHHAPTVLDAPSPAKGASGPDLSLESQSPALRYLDTNGHGTHMGGIVAGQDDGEVTGIAPDARLVSVKVGAASGATDISQVIAAIDWVVHHRNHDGLSIRVLNLSFGTDGAQDYLLDPLTTPSTSPGARASWSWSRPATAGPSGVVALLLQKRPALTPDQVKALVRNTANDLAKADALGPSELYN